MLNHFGINFLAVCGHYSFLHGYHILIHAKLFGDTFFFDWLFVVYLQNVRRAVSDINHHVHTCHIVKILRDRSIALRVNEVSDNVEVVMNVIVLAVDMGTAHKILSCAFTLDRKHCSWTADRKIYVALIKSAVSAFVTNCGNGQQTKFFVNGFVGNVLLVTLANAIIHISDMKYPALKYRFGLVC